MKDILVHLDNSRACEARVKTAMALAAKHDAHLTGLYVLPQLVIPTYAEIQIGDDLLEQQREVAKAQVKPARKAFRATAK